ncbi:MAG: HlyD family efflux transporter periplasmic adaptor subunit [Bacillota bacterium]|nr:HlyD family efflux transporter periplasmic adaptor subunit [Bacillota bacterium]
MSPRRPRESDGIESFPLADRGRLRDRRAPQPGSQRFADPDYRPPDPTRRDPAALRATVAADEALARHRNSQKQRRRRRAGMLALGFVVLLVVAIVIIVHVYEKEKSRPQLLFVYQERLELGFEAEALVIRDEELILSPLAGLVDPAVPEGQHAAVGEELVLVIGSTLEPVLDERRSIDRQISDRQLELLATGRGEAARPLYEEAERSIRQLVSEMRLAAIRGRAADFIPLDQAMAAALRQRSGRLAAVDLDDGLLSSLMLSRERLQEVLGAGSGVISAARPGLVSFRSDGRETELVPGLLERLSPAELEVALADGSEIAPLAETVTAGQPVLRRVYGSSYYLLLYVRGIENDWFDGRTELRLRLPAEDNLLLRCRIERSEPDSSGILLGLATDEGMARLLDERKLRVKLLTGDVSGILVPQSALLNRSGDGSRAAVMLVTANRARLHPVDVLGLTEADALLAPDEELKQGSLIVRNPETVTDGGVIDD